MVELNKSLAEEEALLELSSNKQAPKKKKKSTLNTVDKNGVESEHSTESKPKENFKKDKRKRIRGTKVSVMEDRHLEDMWQREDRKPPEDETKEEALAKMKVNPGRLTEQSTVKAEEKSYRKMQEMMIKSKHKRLYRRMMHKKLEDQLEIRKMKSRRKRIDA